jgi:hypothetical protein
MLRIGEVAELSIMRDGKPTMIRATIAQRAGEQTRQVQVAGLRK